eukprot:CAMPEP_0168180262 /NCGR_PEP_ID=MMETSP0139_2-20121125/10408_1 /TAXON_ID=44445 /ORGANISM="Pseudo-nitzschia australis, Strain 10249 10 AB" /LENGTH=330 /DNA_ID=CAMNT_0008100397 /DNA_START=94 /DNA_END=1083 /DNA_ORIENTATION=+
MEFNRRQIEQLMNRHLDSIATLPLKFDFDDFDFSDNDHDGNDDPDESNINANTRGDSNNSKNDNDGDENHRCTKDANDKSYAQCSYCGGLFTGIGLVFHQKCCRVAHGNAHIPRGPPPRHDDKSYAQCSYCGGLFKGIGLLFHQKYCRVAHGNAHIPREPAPRHETKHCNTPKTTEIVKKDKAFVDSEVHPNRRIKDKRFADTVIDHPLRIKCDICGDIFGRQGFPMHRKVCGKTTITTFCKKVAYMKKMLGNKTTVWEGLDHINYIINNVTNNKSSSNNSDISNATVDPSDDEAIAKQGVQNDIAKLGKRKWDNNSNKSNENENENLHW